MTPRERKIYSAAENVHRWLEVLDALEQGNVMSARLKAQRITDTGLDDNTLTAIYEKTNPLQEFIITGDSIPRWRFWDQHNVPLIDNCELRVGLLMAAKYRHYMKNGSSGNQANPKTFPNGITLNYTTHEIIDIDQDAPECLKNLAPYEFEYLPRVLATDKV